MENKKSPSSPILETKDLYLTRYHSSSR